MELDLDWWMRMSEGTWQGNRINTERSFKENHGEQADQLPIGGWLPRQPAEMAHPAITMMKEELEPWREETFGF
jgi:hypothetical protein